MLAAACVIDKNAAHHLTAKATLRQQDQSRGKETVSKTQSAERKEE
jgi:hypothetical protein